MLVLVLGGLAQAPKTSEMSFMVTVRKIEAGDAHTSLNEFLQLGNLPASRTHGTNDFGLPTQLCFQKDAASDLVQRNVGSTERGALGSFRRHDKEKIGTYNEMLKGEPGEDSLSSHSGSEDL